MNSPFSFILTPDDHLRRAILASLEAENRNYLKRLSIDVEMGRVVMEGIVGSYHEKQIALSCVQKGAPSATIIDNTLVIPQPPRPVSTSPRPAAQAHELQEVVNQ